MTSDDEPRFNAEDAAALHCSLATLDVRHREVLVLHFLEDMPVDQVAAVVGCPPGTVKSRIYHAKRALKEALCATVMAHDTGPKSDADQLRDRLLGQWEPDRPSYLHYRKEVENMLAIQEKKLRREKWFTNALWIYIVLLTTCLMTGSGLLMIHKIEGTFIAVSAVFWLIFGAVFFFIHQINKSRFEVIKEIKGVELRLAALEERLMGRVGDTGTSS